MEENSSPDFDEIREETLPPNFEDGGEESEKSDRTLNVLIPSMVGQFAFGSAPTSALPPGAAPSPESEQSQRYVNNTAPILEMIDFHRCLGPMTEIPPTARLVIGTAVLIGGVVVMKIQVKKGEKKEDGDETDTAKH